MGVGYNWKCLLYFSSHLGSFVDFDQFLGAKLLTRNEIVVMLNKSLYNLVPISKCVWSKITV